MQQSFGFGPPARTGASRRNLVIEAGAGTGKTTAIVGEVLKLMLADETLDPERIVLVTFTEKAAGEIADRIHEALAEIESQFDAGGDVAWPPGSPHALIEVPPARREEWARACRVQLARIDSLRSQTIHSFCQSLLRQFPIEAGLDPQFRIIEGFERTLLYGQLYDAWVDQETRLDPREEQLAQWELLMGHVGYLFLIRDLLFALLERRDLLVPRPFAPRERGEGARSADEGLFGGGIELVEQRILEALDVVRRFDENRICSYVRTTEPPPPGTAIDAWIDYLAPIANDIRTTDLPKGGKFSALSDAMKTLRADPKNAKGNSIHDRLVSHRAASALHALARRFVAYLDEEKRTLGVVDFDDLLLRTLALLEDAGVAERIRGQIDYLFVDEFQDTDRTQARILSRLARDRSGAFVPGRMIVVGDPKQSIYGFRRADPETYHRMKLELLRSGADERQLEDQYRSDPALVDAVNAIFACMFPDAPHDANVFRPAYHGLRAARTSNGRELDARIVFLHADAEEKFLSEGEAIAEWILAHRDGGPLDLQRFALLFRRLTKLDDYLDTFDRYGIDYVLPPTRLFLDRRAPVDLLAVLRAIAYPFDKGAEISAARTPYFALTDDEIVSGVTPSVSEGPGRAGGEQHPGATQPPGPSLTLGVTYASYLAALHRYRDASRRLTISQLIDLVIATSNIEAVFDAAADGARSRKHIEHLRAIAFEYDRTKGGSVRQFVDEIDRRRGEPDEMEPSLVDESRNAVRILTVHAAKGLEFDTVILPDLVFPTKPAEIFATEEPRRLVMRGQVETLASYYEHVDGRPLREIASEREDAEMQRLFYVAVTRAKHEVVFVWSGEGKQMGFSKCLSQVFGPPTFVEGREVRASLGLPIAYEKVEIRGAGSRRRKRLADEALEQSLAAGPIVDVTIASPEVTPRLDVGDAARQRAARHNRPAGNLLHRLLERWDGVSPHEPLLRLLAAEAGASDETIARVRQRIPIILKSETFARMQKAETLGRELPIRIPLEDGTVVERRIDRFIREDGRDIVVDYKSGDPDPRDIAQVTSYAAAMSRMTGRECGWVLWYVERDEVISG